MANLVSDKFKNSLKSSMKEHIINFLERKRLSGSPYERQPERLIAFDSLLAEFSLMQFQSLRKLQINGWNSFLKIMLAITLFM